VSWPKAPPRRHHLHQLVQCWGVLRTRCRCLMSWPSQTSSVHSTAKSTPSFAESQRSFLSKKRGTSRHAVASRKFMIWFAASLTSSHRRVDFQIPRMHQTATGMTRGVRASNLTQRTMQVLMVKTMLVDTVDGGKAAPLHRLLNRNQTAMRSPSACCHSSFAS